MGIYMCEGCDELKDDDHDPMSEDELCEQCQMERACEYCGEYDEHVKDGWHERCRKELAGEKRGDQQRDER